MGMAMTNFDSIISCKRKPGPRELFKNLKEDSNLVKIPNNVSTSKWKMLLKK